MDLVTPSRLGFDIKRLQRIDSAMKRFADDGRLAGVATLLLRKGQIVHEHSSGLASVALNRPMQMDTLFRIWSITKAVTTVAALTLYEQGLFTLDQDISEFLPEFKDTPVYVSGEGDSMIVEPRKNPLSIRYIMAHAAGIGGSHTDPIDQMMMARVTRQPLDVYVRRIAEVPLRTQPGTVWHYSRGFELIARMVEVISGQPYCDYLRDHVLEPLGMTDTAYTVPDERYERFGALYEWDPERNFVEVLSPSESREYIFRETSSHEWSGEGGTGLISTPRDIARFAQMLLNGGMLDGVRILAPRTVALMSTNHLPAALIPCRFPEAQPIRGYGHGLGVHTLMDYGLAGVPCMNGEFWKDGGAGTLFWVDPALELVGVAMYQLLDFWRVPVFHTFRATAYQALEDL